MVRKYGNQTLFVVSTSGEDDRPPSEILRRERDTLIREIAEVTINAQKALHGDGDPEAYLRHAHTARLLEGQLASLDRMLGLT